jgi:hypothetical protein
MYGDFGFLVLGDVVHAAQPRALAVGIRAGDRIVFSAMPPEDRYDPPARPAPIGRTVTFHFLRGNTQFTRTLTAAYDGGEWSLQNLWATIAKKSAVLVLIVFAAALFLARPTLLSGALFVMAIGWTLAFPMFYAFLPVQPYLWLSTICDFLRLSAPIAFLSVALLLSAAKAPTENQRFSAVLVPIALFLAASRVNSSLQPGTFERPVAGLLFTAPKICILAGIAVLLVIALRRSVTAGTRIAALSLAFAGVSRLSAGPMLLLLPEWMQGVTEFISDSSIAITVIAALVVVYVVIRERVVDTGLVMSRILSYAALLAGIVALLGVIDWAFAAQLAAHPLVLPAEVIAAVFIGYRFSGFRDVAHALSLAAIDAPAAAAQGRVRDERDALVRALGLAERTRQSGLIAEIRARCAFSAWFHGDDEAFESHLAALRSALGARSLRGLSALAHVEDPFGMPDVFDSSTLAEWKARALLVAYGNASDASLAEHYAHGACMAADESGLPWPRILARVALAEISPDQRAQLLTAAIEIAKDAGWLPLTKSLLALRSDARDAGLLEPFVTARLHKIRAAQPTVEVSFFSGDVRVFGAPVQLHEKERALLFTVALAETAINSDELVDSLWPEADGDAARTAFRACLYRLRKQSGNDRIVHRAGKGYTLCAGADVDLWKLQHALDARRHDELTALHAAFIAGREQRAMLGSWFDPFERMLSRRMQEVKRVLDARESAML